MTNKINGIDVSECEHHYTNPVNGIIYHGCAIYEQKNELGYWQDTLCEQNPNCYFKQLKRLQKENEKLKKKKDEYYLRTLDYEAKISYLIQALEEIRKWATHHNPCDIGRDINCTKEDCFECLNYDIKKITKIINEVLEDSEDVEKD